MAIYHFSAKVISRATGRSAVAAAAYRAAECLADDRLGRAQDFRATKVLRNYYEDSGEDAFQMEHRVGGDDEPDGFAVPVNRVAQYEGN